MICKKKLSSIVWKSVKKSHLKILRAKRAKFIFKIQKKKISKRQFDEFFDKILTLNIFETFLMIFKHYVLSLFMPNMVS